MLCSSIIVNACLYDTSTPRVLYKMHSFKVALAYTYIINTYSPTIYALCSHQTHCHSPCMCVYVDC